MTSSTVQKKAHSHVHGAQIYSCAYTVNIYLCLHGRWRQPSGAVQYLRWAVQWALGIQSAAR